MPISFKTSPDKSNGTITIGTTDVITLEGDGRVVFKNTSSFAANSITSNNLVETVVPGTYGSSNSIPQITVTVGVGGLAYATGNGSNGICIVEW